MPKVLTKTVFALFGASVLCAAALRCLQLFSQTDIKTGFLIKEASLSAGAVYILCVVAAACCGIFFNKRLTAIDPFTNNKSKRLFYVCVLTGAAMFYDFVHQCVNCYDYASRNAHLELNRFVPMFITGITAILCTFYFIIMGISFVTDKYDFRRFIRFHLVLAIRFIAELLTCLTRYDDGFLAVENNLRCAVLIFGIIFSVALLRNIDGSPAAPRVLCFAGLSYAALSFIFAVPRGIAFICGAELYKVDFSSVSYLFIGIFAIALTAEAFKIEKTKEV